MARSPVGGVVTAVATCGAFLRAAFAIAASGGDASNSAVKFAIGDAGEGALVSVGVDCESGAAGAGKAAVDGADPNAPVEAGAGIVG